MPLLRNSCSPTARHSSYSSALTWRKCSFDVSTMTLMLRRLSTSSHGCLLFRSIPGHTADDVELLRKYVKRFASHACQMKYKGKVLISTFAGDQCRSEAFSTTFNKALLTSSIRFGHDTMIEGWNYVLSVLEQITPVYKYYLLLLEIQLKCILVH